ncbi:hypothetical protein IG631_04400 [Alternaria alternata]|nr:hypothetical protein IG631_04400 [Alternaria alternata]
MRGVLVVRKKTENLRGRRLQTRLTLIPGQVWVASLQASEAGARDPKPLTMLVGPVSSLLLFSKSPIVLRLYILAVRHFPRAILHGMVLRETNQPVRSVS